MKVQIKIDAVTTLDIENNMPGVSNDGMTRLVLTQVGYDGQPDRVIDRRLVRHARGRSDRHAADHAPLREAQAAVRHAPPRRGRRGNCYVICEALYWLLGGPKSGWTPHTVRHEGDVHWFLRRGGWLKEWQDGMQVLDPTAAQFRTEPDYSEGRGRGFLTREPSRRARELMDRMLWSDRDMAVVPRQQTGRRKSVKSKKSQRRGPGSRAAGR